MVPGNSRSSLVCNCILPTSIFTCLPFVCSHDLPSVHVFSVSLSVSRFPFFYKEASHWIFNPPSAARPYWLNCSHLWRPSFPKKATFQCTCCCHFNISFLRTHLNHDYCIGHDVKTWRMCQTGRKEASWCQRMGVEEMKVSWENRWLWLGARILVA